MNNIFDIKRFGNYFLYDLRNAKNNYGLSLLILGTLSISTFVIYELFSLVFSQHFSEMPVAMKYMVFFAAITVVILGAGTKIYGTDEEKAQAFIAEVYAMNERMGIPKGFDFIREKDIPQMVKWALQEANPTYPVPVVYDEEHCEAVIRRIIAMA